MCGNAEPRCEHNFFVRKMGSAVNAPCGIMIVSGDEKVDLKGGSSGKLVAVIGDVIGLGVVCNVVAGGSGKRVCKRVE